MKTYTYTEYDMEDYDIKKYQVYNMSLKELASCVENIARGWIPDYNFTGDESDFYNYEKHMVMQRVANILKNSIDNI